jgi:YceI-like protein
MKAHPNGCACTIVALVFLAGPGKSQTSSQSSSVDQGKSNASADTTLTRYEAKPGSKVRIEGISTRSDWQVESTLIGGFLEVGGNFPTEPGQSAKPGKVKARTEVFVLIRSLKSIEKGGRPFSDEMDKIMYGKLNVQNDPTAKITYHLTELVLRETPKSKDEPYVFDSKGELAIAGVTNLITMTINLLPLGDKKLKISGSSSLKMTDYKIQPPTPKLFFGPLKTGDEVKLIFEWVLAQKAAARAATAE